MQPFIRRFAGLFSVYLVLSTAAASGAPKPRLPPKMVYIAIVAVDPTAMTITVEPRNSMSTEAKTYKISTTATIKVRGNPAMLADLKPDMQIHFHLAADGATADELSASPPPRGSE